MKKLNIITEITALAVILTAGALFATQTSERIETTFKNSFVYITYLRDDAIKIQSTNDSVVSLTGTVSEWFHSSLAEETVAGLPGVWRVDNKLEVKAERPGENSDAWISMKVKTMLLFHKNVSNLKIDVEVLKGVVTLRGQAVSEAQKELTTEYVKDVEWVQTVKNDMTVGKSKKTTSEKVSEYIDDASITAQVKLALLFHRATSVVNTKIETKNGIVKISGVAKNTAERDLVSKLVTDIHGVKSLKNEMTIG
jgi:hyperosmotically inducible periplasmic protein